MKNLFLATILIMTLFIASCSQKLPTPTADNTGVLIVPTSISNHTQYRFGYYYQLLYSPEKNADITIFPRSGRDFVIIDGFPAGDYEINAIKIMNSGSGGIPDSISKVYKAKNPMPFRVESGTITVLNQILIVKQSYPEANNIERYSQWFNFQTISADQRNNVSTSLKKLPNAELWEMIDLSAARQEVVLGD